MNSSFYLFSGSMNTISIFITIEMILLTSLFLLFENLNSLSSLSLGTILFLINGVASSALGLSLLGYLSSSLGSDFFLLNFSKF